MFRTLVVVEGTYQYVRYEQKGNYVHLCVCVCVMLSIFERIANHLWFFTKSLNLEVFQDFHSVE